MATQKIVSEVAPELKEAIREQVARIRGSHHFRSSKRCLQLLEFITEQTLEGQTERLKERSLGVEVFGRDAGYDTGQDPIVRYTAGEVRKRLAQYYQQAGHDSELRINLPLGSYVPEFQTAPEAPPVVAIAAERWKIRPMLLLAGAAILVVAAAAWAAVANRRHNALERFWQPALSDRGPVLLSVGEARVFSFPEPLRTEIRNRAQVYFDAGKPVPESVLLTKDLLPLWDRYVPIGDAICLARLTALLEQRGKPYRIRGGRATSLADLRDGPGVLIGAFTNEWSMRMSEGQRFTMEFDSKQSFGAIWDRTRPGAGWKVPNTWPDPKKWTDYGLVSRARHPSTGKTVIIAAGLNRYATSAAGELISSADAFDEALRQAPPDWYRKNIQIVFSTPVVEGNAGPPSVVALHVW